MGKWISVVSLACTNYDKQPLFMCLTPYLREYYNNIHYYTLNAQEIT